MSDRAAHHLRRVDRMSDDEQRAVRSLRRVAKNWPSTLWLFSASGQLHVMRRDTNGDRAKLQNGAMDPDYIVASIDIPNDGGDW